MTVYYLCLFLVRLQRYMRSTCSVAKMKHHLDIVQSFRPGCVLVNNESEKVQRANAEYTRFVDRFIRHYEDMHHYNVTQALFHHTMMHCCALYDAAMEHRWNPSTCFSVIARLAATRLPPVCSPCVMCDKRSVLSHVRRLNE